MSADLVKELRDRTGAGFMDCKKALAENNNDLEKAMEFLRVKGIANASKKGGRSANDGRIQSYIHSNGKIGVMVEVNCETDFVAKTDDFTALAANIAMHIAAASPRWLNKEAVSQTDIEKEREILKTQAEEAGKKGPVVEKIVEGKIGKFYEENCLLQQRYVKDPDKTIEDLVKESIAKLGENISIKRFVRFQLGEKTA